MWSDPAGDVAELDRFGYGQNHIRCVEGVVEAAWVSSVKLHQCAFQLTCRDGSGRHDIVVFGRKAVDEFLDHTGCEWPTDDVDGEAAVHDVDGETAVGFRFQYIIRAHECQPTGDNDCQQHYACGSMRRHIALGLRVGYTARVITIFSSSGYCGGSNGDG